MSDKLKTGIANQRDREFAFTVDDFEKVRKMIYERAGISLSSSKQDMVYSRVSRRLRATGINNFRDYLAVLEKNNEVEWEAFVNSLTTNLTAFFREPHHFPLLAEHALKQSKTHRISLWCSASSTGEEPYSMAMALVDAFGSFTPPVTIIASDVDTNVLAKAEDGIYPSERIEMLSANMVKRFFLKGVGKHAGLVQIKPELKEMITFRPINLLDYNWPIRGPLDAIFCRNVMIYFDKDTQRNILERFAPLLQPDGLLFAGHSESFPNAGHVFSLRGKTVYDLKKT